MNHLTYYIFTEVGKRGMISEFSTKKLCSSSKNMRRQSSSKFPEFKVHFPGSSRNLRLISTKVPEGKSDALLTNH